MDETHAEEEDLAMTGDGFWKRATATSVYGLRITLRDTHPPIWRAVEVTGGTTLHKLHWIFQLTMGWTNSHLHQFLIGNETYGQREFDDDPPPDLRNEHEAGLVDVLWRPSAVFVYEYDFGDSWEHDVLVEGIYPRSAGKKYPICIEGERACPPEDCGGVHGFYEMLESIEDPRHPEHEDVLTWLGGGFDPDAFDLAEVNRALRRLRGRRSLDPLD
jgi:hypothetical protein